MRRVISMSVALAAVIYAVYLGLHGLPHHVVTEGGLYGVGPPLPWPLGPAFGALFGVFFVGVALRIQVMVVCALLLLGVGSALLITSYGLHFGVITLILTILASASEPATS
jgi:hypothetical protein